MIEILDEMLQLACPGIGVKIGTKCIHGKYYIDDLSIMTSNINHLQRIINIIEIFCESFGFKVNISKTEICVFNKRGANIPNIQIRYLGVLIKVVDGIKYLGLIFSGINKKSPNIENLALAAERARFAVQNRMNKFTGLSPEIKIRLGNLLIRPVASFGCQIWGVNFLDIKKGVDNNELERVHVRFLRHILGVGKNIACDNLRAEASSPAYHE